MIIAIANQKGGVGKTATAVTLAHGAALRGNRVLLVDLDPQGNVADSLGLSEGNDLIRLLERFEDRQPMTITARENLEVVRSNKLTAGYKNTLAARDYRELVIAEALLPGDSLYDYIFLDCAPSVDVLHVAALTAADYVIIPTKLDQFAVKGISEILSTLMGVNKRGGSCSLAGIVPTFYDRTTTETQRQLEHLAKAFQAYIWPVIPVDTNLRQANRAGLTLWEYLPSSRAITGIDGIGGGYQSVLNRLSNLKG